MVSKQQCAFIQFTTRAAAEAAAEKSFNKLIIQGRRLNVKWGKAQGATSTTTTTTEDNTEAPLQPVPGLPGGTYIFFRIYYSLTIQ